MTVYGLFYRFVNEDVLSVQTAHFSMNARKHAEGDGWEFIGEEPITDQIEAVRQSDETRWGLRLRERP